MYTYEADFRYDALNQTWRVEFSDFDGAFADGDTLKEAVNNAGEALKRSIASCLDSGKPLPQPTFSNPLRHIVCVDVDDEFIARNRCMTVGKAAEELGVTPSRVSQLLSEGRLEAYMYGGTRLVTKASVKARKASKLPAHRPPKANR